MTAQEPLKGDRLEALLDRLPAKPGVYLMKGKDGRVIYVGKAKRLRARVRSYFRASGDTRAFVARLERELFDLEFVVTPSEKDALILERDQIARLRPRYNVDWLDDKNFLSIRITTGHPFPRLLLDRKHPACAVAGCAAEGLWFGPYTSAAAARECVRLVQSVFLLRVCSDAAFAARKRPCILHQIQRCLGPCVLPVPPAIYAAQVAQAIAFLRGRRQGVVDQLTREMQAASTARRYEDAARLRDRMRAVAHTLSQQRVLDAHGQDRDVLGFYREGASGVVLLLQGREGRLAGTSVHPFRNVEAPSSDLIRQFLLLHYGSGADLPEELLLPAEASEADEGGGDAEDLGSLQEWLSEIRGGRVRVLCPSRGLPAQILQMARENAAETYRVRTATAELGAEKLRRLQRRLHLQRLPHRIECFDLSTSAGKLSVGSMAVLIDGAPAPAEYRRYRIREAQTDSDVAMMREVLGRRFRRLQEAGADRVGGEPPDLVVLDGGVAQLNAVLALLADLGVSDLDVVALAKGRTERRRGERFTEQVFLPNRKNPVLLKPESDELFLLSRVRDEAHRFAIQYHRGLRRKAAIRSLLDEIPGVGPVLRRRLLARFGSLKGVRQASAAELGAVPGVGAALADRIAAVMKLSTPLTPAAGPDTHSVGQ